MSNDYKAKVHKQRDILMLVLAVFITSIPFAIWTAIASTIMPVQLGAEDSSEVSTSLLQNNDVTVDYPTSSDEYAYVEGKTDPPAAYTTEIGIKKNR